MGGVRHEGLGIMNGRTQRVRGLNGSVYSQTKADCEPDLDLVYARSTSEPVQIHLLQELKITSCQNNASTILSQCWQNNEMLKSFLL